MSNDTEATRREHIDALARRLRDLIPAEVWREAIDGNDELAAFHAIASVLLEADAVPERGPTQYVARTERLTHGAPFCLGPWEDGWRLVYAPATLAFRARIVAKFATDDEARFYVNAANAEVLRGA